MNKNEQNFIDKTIKRVGKAINTYGLIAENDHVAVALSGGKDSMVLLETLALRKKNLPIDYKITAIHIKIEEMPYEINHAFVEKFCNELDVPFICKTVSMGRDTSGNSPCFLCAHTRRKELFSECEQLACSKLALGHHMEDALETLLLNMVYNGAMSSMPPKLSMFDGRLEIIRPLILVKERDVQYYAKLKEFNGIQQECAYAHDTKRSDMKKIIEELQGMHKQAKYSMFKAMSNIHKEYLPPE